jgi:hypothetical protein
MKNKDVKKTVKKAYSKIATGSDSCCSCGCTCNDSQTAKRISKEIGYSDDEMNAVPEANLGLGCGNPTALGKIKEGMLFWIWEVVLGLIASWRLRKLAKRAKLLVWT